MIPTRLYWNGHTGRGLAQHDGVSVELRFAPTLPGVQHMTTLVYCPGEWGIVRIAADRERELDPIERRYCSCILRRVAFSARAECLQPMGSDVGDELITLSTCQT